MDGKCNHTVSYVEQPANVVRTHIVDVADCPHCLRAEIERLQADLKRICGPYDVDHVVNQIYGCSCEECSLGLLDLNGPPCHVICQDCAASAAGGE